MLIEVTSGVGTGPTTLAAFDAALRQAGVADHNLIKLSSIIPDGATVRVVDPQHRALRGAWGDRLYVVMADERVDTPNVEAWAGIGWAQCTNTGKGLFVEHQGGSKKTVENDIYDSLDSLFQGRNLQMGNVGLKSDGITCSRDPVCAVVTAAFCTSSWTEASRQLDEVLDLTVEHADEASIA